MKLVTLDLDGTLLPDDTVFAAVLRDNGHAEFVAESDRRYFAGELSLEDCFWEQWAKIQELSLADCHRALRKAAWLPGISDGVHAIKQQGLDVCLLTDQPNILTDYLGRWGLIDAVCSPVTVKEGRAVDVDARFDKAANLAEALRKRGIDATDVVHVGNGSNDVPVWEMVGQGVAAFAEPDVAQHADVDLGRPADLVAIADAIATLKT